MKEAPKVPPLGTIPLFQLLQIPEKSLTVTVQDHLPDLETLTPVQGQVRVEHKGTFLQVQGQARAIVTLVCDRCLAQYNHRIELDTTEIIWLQSEGSEAPVPLELEVAFEDLVERLAPSGSFDPGQWLYEQLCLALPAQKLCDLDCGGIELDSDADSSEAEIDHRWAALAQLKQQMSP
jgi:uncharacterized protein